MIKAIWRRQSVLALLLLVVTLAPVGALAVTLEEEIDLGKKLDVEILRQYRQTDDQAAIDEINEYGNKLIQGVWRPEIEYNFRILKDDELNAFSTPGGYVYFSERLWRTMRKDERIGVLSHEIVHTDRRHALDAISKQQRRQLWLAVILGVLGANRTLGDVAGLAESLYSLKYSRGDEQQADEEGVKLAQEAGYNPAGLLLAMRKIQRFHSDSGGEPPAVFSSHPPTRERLDYITKLLTDMSVPIPPENVPETDREDRVGTVTGVWPTKVEVKATADLKPGQIVWLMGPGWDFYYEKHTPVPMGRGVVRQTGDVATLETWALSTEKQKEIKQGIGVYAPPLPAPEKSPVKMTYVSRDADPMGKLQSEAPLAMFDRLLARQPVWNKDLTELVYDNVGYVVVTDPAHPTGYIAAGRPGYGYAPVASDSVLVKLDDKDAARWVGPVKSIGRGGKTIEVLPNRELSSDKTYEVLQPAWNPDQSYETRTVGTAKLKSTSGKIVLQIVTFSAGWNIDNVRNGFDVYEKAEQQ